MAGADRGGGMLDFLVIGSFRVPIPFKSFLNAISVYSIIFLQWSLKLQGYNPDGTKLPGIWGFGVRGQAVKTDALQGQSSLRTSGKGSNLKSRIGMQDYKK